MWLILTSSFCNDPYASGAALLMFNGYANFAERNQSRRSIVFTNVKEITLKWCCYCGLGEMNGRNHRSESKVAQ